MKTALYFEPFEEGKVRCLLCPHRCILSSGERGKCGVRKSNGDVLIAENYGLISAVNLDPIEKKPLYHFYPGRKIWSMGCIGCNLSCFFCQNCDISTVTIEDFSRSKRGEAPDVLKIVEDDKEGIGLAYTYNEPTVYYEYMLDLAKEVKSMGKKNVMVSNGYINDEPLHELMPFIDAFNIDLKGFSDKFYKKAAGAHLKPVKTTLSNIKKAGKHLEVTFLLVPSQNDDERHFKEMVKWLACELGPDTVLHISRYFPAHKASMPKTSLNLIYRFYQIAQHYLSYVYLGNVTGSESQNTICGSCDRVVISRYADFIQKNGIDQDGFCVHCKSKIVIV